MEHIQGDAWWTRYQPVSYNLNSRSGNEDQFKSMVQRCNAVGVNVIVDMVINHMSGHGSSGTGTGGCGYDGGNEDYPCVPFSSWDFHQPFCEISNYGDANDVRNCYLVGLNDLDGGKDYVRQKIAEYANKLISYGVKGFRVDASKHMWPGDLQAIQGMFSSPIFTFHEVIDHGGEAVGMGEYFGVGKVTEFNYGPWVSCIRNGDFNCLSGIGRDLRLIDGLHAQVFIDNHDNQRGHGGGGGPLTHKEDYLYKMAVCFMLAHDYGFKRVMSSYYFDNTDQGPPGAPPQSVNNGDYTCGNGWACEHRWRPIMNMVEYANAMAGLGVENWQVKDGSLGFSRGSKGFFAMGNLNNVNFYTGLPDGEYCDITSDCAQKIRISGGSGTFSKYVESDAVVAIIAA